MTTTTMNERLAALSALSALLLGVACGNDAGGNAPEAVGGMGSTAGSAGVAGSGAGSAGVAGSGAGSAGAAGAAGSAAGGAAGSAAGGAAGSAGIGAEPCASVTCSGHGTCEVIAGEAVCDCEDGYHAEQLSCEANDGWDAPSSTPIASGARIPMVTFFLKLRGYMSKYKELVDLCAANHFTHVMVMMDLTDVKCESLEGAGFLFKSGALSIARLQELVDYISSKGLKPLPGLKLLTHQNQKSSEVGGGVGASFPVTHDFMINKSTYNPHSTELMDLIHGCIDEMMPLFEVNGEKPAYFNIGHDELAGHWPYYTENWLTCDQYAASYKPCEEGVGCEPILSPQGFKDSILGLRDHITGKHGVRIAMYPDSLIQKAELSHGGQFEGHAGCVEGPDNGLVQVRHELPKDIVMLPWEYGYNSDYPTLFEEFRILQDEGFDVQDVTWPTQGVPHAIPTMRYRIDEMLTHGNDHSGIIAVEFRFLPNYMPEIQAGIEATGEYAWNTKKQ